MEPDTGLITGCALTAGNTHDGVPVTDLLDAGTTPVEVLADSAYGSAATRTALADAGHSSPVGHLPAQYDATPPQPTLLQQSPRSRSCWPVKAWKTELVA